MLTGVATVLITGGAGFIGSHLASDALSNGDRVLIVDNLVTGRRENVPDGALFFERDLAAPGLEQILRNEHVDVVSHHAAQANVRISVDDPVHDAQANIVAGVSLIQACRLAGVRKVLFASSGGTIYGPQERHPCDEEHPKRPLSPYGCSKLSLELFLGAYGRIGEIDPVILRYANVYGPRQDPMGEAGIVAILAEKFLTGEPPRIFGDGSQTRDYVHVSDIARVHRAVLANWTSGTYNVGTGIETALVDVFRRVGTALGHSTPPVHVPALRAELLRNSLDSTRLRRTFEVGPEVGLDQGLAMTLPWYVQKYAA